MNKKHILWQSYYYLFHRHPLSSLTDLNLKLGKRACNLFYQGDNLWDTYPLDKCTEGNDILFIHIPKCAGTSLANFYGHDHLPHYPASIFYFLDKERYLKSKSFAIVRDPLDRIASMISHFSSSKFITSKEIKLAQKMKLTQDNLRDNIVKFLIDESFRFKLFNFTKPGRDGFPVSQLEYIEHNEKIIVQRLFSFENISKMGEWLEEISGKKVTIPHSNPSSNRQKFKPDEELIQLCKKKYSREYFLYELVMESGGTLETRKGFFSKL